MNDSVYQSPKTDPTLNGVKFTELPKQKISVKRVMFCTFTPSVLLLLGGIVSGLSDELFLLTGFSAPALAFIFSIYAAIELTKGKGVVNIFGYFILFIICHVVLLFVALFTGLGISSLLFPLV